MKMKTQLLRLWESRSPGERIIAAVVAVIVGAVLYLWLVQSADRARAQLRASVTKLRADAVRIEQQAAEFERLRATRPAPASHTDLRTLVQAQAGAAGLDRALVRIDARDSDQVQISFGAVAFSEWLSWVSSLQSQRIRLDACRIEGLSTPGMVSVTATLVRPKPR